MRQEYLWSYQHHIESGGLGRGSGNAALSNSESDGDITRINESVFKTGRVPENAVFQKQSNEVMSSPNASRNDLPCAEMDEKIT